ncbi:MAG: hypothetical protein KAT65_09310 [Methanophagales archaeon]|nr:hypothetical protein [Methanophagales archaeon]
MGRMRQEEYLHFKKHNTVSLDKNLEYVIYREYKDVRFPIDDRIKEAILSGVDFEEISEGWDESSSPFFTLDQKTTPLSPADIKTLDIISDLEGLIEDVKENFDDISARQIFFFELKEKLNELWNISKGDMKKAALRLEYAIKNIKSERLNEKQVDALAEAIEVLEKSGGKGKEEIKKILLDVGIFTVPKIEGLAELYADE